MTRYFYIVLFMSLIGVGIVIKAAHIMFVDRKYWEEVASRFKKEDVTLYPNRGNILSGDGKLLASSLPEYYLFLDYKYYDNNEKRQADRFVREGVSAFQVPDHGSTGNLYPTGVSRGDLFAGKPPEAFAVCHGVSADKGCNRRYKARQSSSLRSISSGTTNSPMSLAPKH